MRLHGQPAERGGRGTAPRGNLETTRSRAVQATRERLERFGWPRLQMTLIVLLTGTSGWLMSAALLHAGIRNMTFRYPLALVGAYVVFLALLWLWLRTNREDYASLADGSGVVDGSVDLPLPRGGGGGGGIGIGRGGGGSFGGGGATAGFQAEGSGVALGSVNANVGAQPAVGSTLEGSSGGSVGKAVGDAVSGLGDSDGIAVVIIAVVAAVGLALASFYVIFIAPGLFAELMVDGVLSYTLYRRLRAHDDAMRPWWQTAIARTIVPFGLTAAFLAGVGAALRWAAPGATTLGEALRMAMG